MYYQQSFFFGTGVDTYIWYQIFLVQSKKLNISRSGMSHSDYQTQCPGALENIQWQPDFFFFSENSGGVCCKNSMSKVITFASFLTVPLGLEVVCISFATTVVKFDTFVLLEKRMINILQQMEVLTNFYRTQVSLGSGLWVPVSLTSCLQELWLRLWRCDSGWWW